MTIRTYPAPGIPFWVEATELGSKRVLDAKGVGKHGIHTFECKPLSHKKSDPADAYDEVQYDMVAAKVKVRNTFDADVPIGDRMLVTMDDIGICNILVWPC